MGDRARAVSARAASSAKAAQALGSKSGGGFGGFSGGAPVAGFGFGAASANAAAIQAAAAAVTKSQGGGAKGGGGGDGGDSGSAGAAADAALPSDLDSEIAMYLRHLAKRDATTKLKALASLRAVVRQRVADGTPVSELALALPPWQYQYRRLYCDNQRTVRQEAAALTGELVAAVGRAAAPHLKQLLGPWWAAQFDPHPDVAAAARAAFQACLPGRKRVDALVYARAELVEHLVEQVASTKEALGDAKRDSVEELEDRHERVVSASLLALATLLEVLSDASSTSSGADAKTSGGGGSGASGSGCVSPEARADVEAALGGLLAMPDVLSGKAVLKSKSRC